MIWKLLVLFQLKHFLCDYPLQFGVMLKKFQDTDWIKGLSIHCAIHAVSTYLILKNFTDLSGLVCLGLALLDFTAHFAMDRIKASPKYLGKFKPIFGEAYLLAVPKRKRENAFFWWSLGVDQLFHHLTHYLIIGIALSILN